MFRKDVSRPFMSLCEPCWGFTCLSAEMCQQFAESLHKRSLPSCAAEQVLELLQCAQQQPHLYRPGCADLSIGKGHLPIPIHADAFLFTVSWSQGAPVSMYRQVSSARALCPW